MIKNRTLNISCCLWSFLFTAMVHFYLQLFFFSLSHFETNLFMWGNPGWMVNLLEFAVVIEIRNRGSARRIQWWKEFLAMLGIFAGCLLECRQNCSPVTVYLYIKMHLIFQRDHQESMCAVPIWTRRLCNSTSWKLAMLIKKLFGRIANYLQRSVEKTFLHFSIKLII